MKTFEKYGFWILFSILLVSGIVYVYFRDFVQTPPDAFAVVSSPWQTWMIKLHVIIAPFFVFCVGWVSVTHTLNKLNKKTKRGKRSGLTNVGILGISILTGYLVQIVTNEIGLKIISNIHIYASVLCYMLIFFHQSISTPSKK